MFTAISKADIALHCKFSCQAIQNSYSQYFQDCLSTKKGDKLLQCLSWAPSLPSHCLHKSTLDSMQPVLLVALVYLQQQQKPTIANTLHFDFHQKNPNRFMFKVHLSLSWMLLNFLLDSKVRSFALTITKCSASTIS